MTFPHVNAWAVLAAGVLIFMLGGLWYSPLLFAKKWIALSGMSEADIKKGGGAQPALFLQAFFCGLVSAYGLAFVLTRFPRAGAPRGAMIGAVCWLAFAAATSYATALFSRTPKGLWLINSAYNLVSFMAAGALLAVWR